MNWLWLGSGGHRRSVARRRGGVETVAVILSLVLLGGLSVASQTHAQPQPRAADAPCRPLTYGGANYTVCTVDLRRYAVKLFWRGPDGAPYGSFDRLAGSAAGRGLVFAMNAGMYHEDRSPVGLYVEGGQQMHGANTNAGFGNFHMKPNGVFYVSGTAAGVMETGRFLKSKPRAAYATQSGPMLVIDGKIHPRFSDDSTSLKVRNGVGVASGSTAVFAISEEAVSFSAFARLFRDELGCRNALFLDGSVSSLYAPALNRMDRFRPMGPIVGAEPR